MSPEQLKKLQRLSDLFESGAAGPAQIHQLSELLSLVNHSREDMENPFAAAQKGISTAFTS
jgi:hypothetical protein